MVSNSLGGLYNARYALLSKIQWKDPETQETIAYPEIFCTTVTPHVRKRLFMVNEPMCLATQLGVAGQHTYAPVGRVLENAIANALGLTGQDVFRLTPLLQSGEAFVAPLQAFPQRIAYANAYYYTDFQVLGSTAAFLGCSAWHRVVASPGPALDEVSIILSLATDERGASSSTECEEKVDDDDVKVVRTESSSDAAPKRRC